MPYQRIKPLTLGIKAPFAGSSSARWPRQLARSRTTNQWIHEIKFDGYRVQLHIVNDGIRLFTRRGNDWAKSFRKIANNAY
jgi:bifunctional non-homologous end joining protein LigD